jgi:hypothetical protein
MNIIITIDIWILYIEKRINTIIFHIKVIINLYNI